MASTINSFKNKVKRLVIEFHYNKNRVNPKEHIIKERDPTQLLLTLRTKHDRQIDEYEEYEEEYVEEIDQSQFRSFDDIAEAEEGEEEEEEDRERKDITTESVREASHRGSLNEVPFNDTYRTLEERRILIDNTNIANQVNYIELEPPSRRKFWFFGKRKNKSHQELSNHTAMNKVKEEDENDNESDTATIEIIAQSTQQQQQQQLVDGEKSTRSLEILEKGIPTKDQYLKGSSYSRKKPWSNNVSLISLCESKSDERCKCAVCERKSNKVPEPWKIIMNDISLQAALLSTGSEPLLKSHSLNLVADFTSSKHDPFTNHKLFANHGSATQMSQVRPSADNLAQFPIANDENEILDCDLIALDEDERQLSVKFIPKEDNRILDTSINITRPSTRQSKLTILSELLEPDPYKGGDTSAVYDGVFLNYDYSDEGINNRDSDDILPLNISNRGLKKIF